MEGEEEYEWIQEEEGRKEYRDDGMICYHPI